MTNWKPNQKQTDFMRVLGEHSEGLTLAQASDLVGYELKSGSVNTLVGKKLVRTEDLVLNCLVVLENEPSTVVGHTKKTVKKYHLVKND